VLNDSVNFGVRLQMFDYFSASKPQCEFGQVIYPHPEYRDYNRIYL
jgi:hypothetical protein